MGEDVVMRYLFGFVCVLALGVVGCSYLDATVDQPECTSHEQCDDGDPCTEDSCGCGLESGRCCFQSVCIWGHDNRCTGEGVCDPTTRQCTYPIVDGGECGWVESTPIGICETGVCRLPCTEAGIRELGAWHRPGTPYTVDCHSPTTIVTDSEISLQGDFVLDGRGALVIVGKHSDRVFAVEENSAIELRGLTVTRASGYIGGGLANYGALTLTGVRVLDCQAPEGGGIYNSWKGALTMSDVVISGNTASEGAGIFNQGTLTIVDSTVSGNSGDGILNEPQGTTTLVRTVVADNSIVNAGILGARNVTASEVWLGHVQWEPYPLCRGFGTATFVNSTIAGAIVAPRLPTDENLSCGEGSFQGTVLSGECDLQEFDSETVHSLGYNIESPGDTCGFDQPTDHVNVSVDDLKLGPLQDNGGPTMTHALLPGSVAIDVIPADDCVDADDEPVSTDQRGEPRDSMCDVGAFEVQP